MKLSKLKRGSQEHLIQAYVDAIRGLQAVSDSFYDFARSQSKPSDDPAVQAVIGDAPLIPTDLRDTQIDLGDEN